MEFGSRRESDADSIEEFPVPFERANDTTAEEMLGRGRDIQAIPWERLQWTREQYRLNRLRHFRNYTNVLQEGEDYNAYLETLDKQCQATQKQGQFYDFVVNSRQVESSIVHFQLRNLLWATSKHDIYLMRDKCINHWDLMSYRCTQVMNLRDDGGTAERGSRLGPVTISTLCAGKGLLAAGGFNGQLVVQKLTDENISHEGFITRNENGITNALEIFDDHGGVRILTSNNDSKVRVFDAESFKMESSFEFDWPVNNSTVCPFDGKIVAVVGDDPNGHILDRSSGTVISQLVGHKDFSFAAAWCPDSRVLATGNQDLTTRLWDMRKTDAPFVVLRGNMGAIRSIRYSSDGRYLAMAEPADFVHIFDVESGYMQSQEIDVFGEISGIAYSPDGGNLFIGVVDETYGSLLEYRRRSAITIW
ncbi:hypothetical protein BSKO_06338 [Bryopsis sp. KO-2023]|nr:hypothetical protein BSKO_06338 [Bryopsis sp. KO-2023]